MMRASGRQPKYLYGFGAVRLSRELQFFKFRQLKAESQACIDDTAFQQSSRIDGPCSVEALLRPQQRIATGLADIQEILGMHKKAGGPDSPRDEPAEDPERHALGPIQVVLQA